MKRLIFAVVFFILSLSITWFTVRATDLNDRNAHNGINQKFIHCSYTLNKTSIDWMHKNKENVYERTYKQLKFL